MADKEISMLPQADSVNDDTIIPAYDPASPEPAKHITGAQFRAFAHEAVWPQVEAAEAAARRAQSAADQINPDEIKKLISQPAGAADQSRCHTPDCCRAERSVF